MPLSVLLVVIVTMQAQDDRNGFLKSARFKANISLWLDIVALVLVVLSYILYTIGVILLVSAYI